jgi:hypothetical protein
MAWASEQNDVKDRFTVEWLRKGDPWQAALTVLGHQNASYASQCASQWPFDPYVIAKRKQLLAEQGEEAFLPTKVDLAREIWRDAENCRDPADKTRNLRLYAEVMGFVEKPDGKGAKGGVIAVTLTPNEVKI